MRLNIEKTALFKKAELLQKVPEEALFELAENSSSLLLKSGETLLFAKTILSAFFIVFKGQLEVHENNGKVKTLGEGDAIGYLEVITAKETDFFVVASEETEVIKIDKDQLLLEIETNPEVALGIINALCYKIAYLETGK